MGFFSFLGVLSPAHISLFTATARAEHVGTDTLGNKYYRVRPRSGYKRERRWVLYDGAPEASNVPPLWHGWLHHQSDERPEEGAESFQRPWQKPHHPNLTGTNQAYRPSGHILSGGHRAKVTGDYEPWRPPE